MTDYKLVPVEPTDEMLCEGMEVYRSEGCAETDLLGIYKTMLAAAPAVQGEPVAYAVFASNGNIRIWGANPAQVEILRGKFGEALQPLYTAPKPAEKQVELVASAPVAAQQRFRHPQKSSQGWSVWQPAEITLDRPSWEIDSQGFEVEYRLLYEAPQPAPGRHRIPDQGGRVMDEFSQGVFFAASVLVRIHDLPTEAADILNEAGLVKADVSSLDDYEKEAMRELVKSEGSRLNFIGLEAGHD